MPANTDKESKELAKKAEALQKVLSDQVKQLAEMQRLAAKDKKVADQLKMISSVLKTQQENTKKILSSMK